MKSNKNLVGWLWKKVGKESEFYLTGKLISNFALIKVCKNRNKTKSTQPDYLLFVEDETLRTASEIYRKARKFDGG